ncbi:4444_t:CDS:2 [Cetraspora pellucida]|uniref:4444_t:CDS:1 n=1 Tax=Cetraspora pellucida TaxID=1433469 RepID=A0A9N9H659_9GLOM|nr:4444_t:CDS:2 [Cetraspora pellucida]
MSDIKKISIVLDLLYFFTFEHNYYKEEIIDYKLVATIEIAEEKLFTEQEHEEHSNTDFKDKQTDKTSKKSYKRDEKNQRDQEG